MENASSMAAAISVTGTSATTRSDKSVGKKILKYVAYTLIGIIVVISVFNLMWKMSGSNRWELVIDQDGTQVYSLKSPGSDVIKFKGITRYDYTYSELIALFNDASFTNDCERFLPGCVEYKFLESWNSEQLFNVQFWRFKLFFPFNDREMVLKGSIVQDKETKVILLENTAVPNHIQPNDCCVRISHLHNTWRYTPVENGRVEVEFVQDLDMGGFFPNILLSFGAAEVHKILETDIPKALADKAEEYRGIKLDWLEEYK